MSEPGMRFGRLTGAVLLAGFLVLSAAPAARAAGAISEQEAHSIGVAAYEYFYPW